MVGMPKKYLFIVYIRKKVRKVLANKKLIAALEAGKL